MRKALREWRFRLHAAWVARFRRFDAEAFGHALQGLGVARGDWLMVHASLTALSGYTGRPVEIVEALKAAVGEEGLLVMPSMTYTDSSKAYLMRGEPLKLRHSPSRMGLVSEVFRRGRGVVRSASPPHPLLAWGADAAAFVDGHERTDRPFGAASPFQRLLERPAKLLCVGTGPESITFTHFLEDRLAAALPFPLYEPEALIGEVIDADGARRKVPTRVLSDESRQRRDESPLWRRATQRGVLRQGRVGNTALLLLDAGALARLIDQEGPAGRLMFRLAPPQAPPNSA